ncbi:hypothetical protein HOY34_07835 [Xinfangfangia sp. D13-10-4-6]|uniref:phasin family protein n=1 Tax=Pseudogemmobacter hezensis TaxID=2737662 RepID=UPI001553421E|nr:phasin family protein [Pseudogemmobacter hezensis]NPD15111.1 hypothetical protein [Pseudogemmobacter hezensis]
MTAQTKIQADSSPFLEFGWFKHFSDLATQPQHFQSALWRESMQTAASLSQLQADWLTKLASVNNPMDVAALTSAHCQNLCRKVIEESTRMTGAITPVAQKAD